MKVICYGDSNTYGYDPRGWLGGRYDAADRWPDILARRTGLSEAVRENSQLLSPSGSLRTGSGQENPSGKISSSIVSPLTGAVRHIRTEKAAPQPVWS